MGSNSNIFWKAFAGKVAAAIFLAICALFGFGPDKWVKFMIQDLPQWFTPGWARATFLTLAFLTLALLVWPWFSKKRSGVSENKDHWTERKQVEIYVLANASAHQEPTALPVDKDPQLTRLREMKDAIKLGELDAALNGERPNAMSTISLESFQQYVSATNKPYWVEVLQRWQKRQSFLTSRISLLDLAKEAEARDWKILDPTSSHVVDFFDAIRQLGVDGSVGIYGRPVHSFVDLTHDEPLIRISQDHWHSHRIDVFSFFKWRHSEQYDYAEDNFQTRVRGLTAAHGESFADIHLDRTAALAWLQTDALAFRGRREKREDSG